MTSLRGRMLLVVGAAVAIAFCVSGVVVVLVMRASLASRLDETLGHEASAVAALVEQDEGDFEWEGSRALLADTTRAMELWREPNERVARSEALTADLVPAAGARELSSVTLPDGRPARQITLRFVPRFDEPRSTASRAVLVIAHPTAARDDTVLRIALVLVIAGVAGTLACLLAARWLVSLGLAPLGAMAARIAAIRETDLAVRLGDRGIPDEVQPVVARLDELLDRLERAFARERDLTAEVAHELRTPIAGLRSTIELALDRERPVDRYREALSVCLSITLQTQRMVEVLLSLARLDAGKTAGSAPMQVSVDALLRDLIAEHEGRAAARGLVFDAALSPLTIAADPEHLRVVLANALDNAVGYATEATTIRVVAGADGIRVSNETTLDPADVRHVFERFWRGDRARLAGLHAGLGLALCKKLVEHMHGTITAEVRDRTFTLAITIPDSSSHRDLTRE